MIYSLNNNDLVLLQKTSIFNQQVLTVQPKLVYAQNRHAMNHICTMGEILRWIK